MRLRNSLVLAGIAFVIVMPLSLFLGLLAGLDVPSTGRIWLGPHEITALDEDGRMELLRGLLEPPPELSDRSGLADMTREVLAVFSSLPAVDVEIEG